MCLPNVRRKMGHNLFNFLYMVWMAPGARALTTADYKKKMFKEGQFHGVATETNTPYNTLTIIRNNKSEPSHVRSLDDLQISLSVETEEAFQLVSPELLMYVLFEKTAIATTTGVYDGTELNDAEEQCIMHNYVLGKYSSRTIENKKTGDGSVKTQKV